MAVIKQFTQSQLVQIHVKIHAREKYFLVIVVIESFHNNNESDTGRTNSKEIKDSDPVTEGIANSIEEVQVDQTYFLQQK